MKETLNIQKLLPEIDLINNLDIRIKTIEVWNRIWEKSSFEKIMDLPISTHKKDYPHIIHNRAVVRMALKVADVLEELHGVKIDRDILLSAAILQYASKLVEYEPSKDNCTLSIMGEQFQHGFYAAHVALEVGLPNEIVQTILCHTPDSSTFPPTLICKILFYIDQIDMAALRGDRWKKMCITYR